MAEQLGLCQLLQLLLAQPIALLDTSTPLSVLGLQRLELATSRVLVIVAQPMLHPQIGPEELHEVALRLLSLDRLWVREAAAQLAEQLLIAGLEGSRGILIAIHVIPVTQLQQ